MDTSQRNLVLTVIGAIALVGAFWFMIMGPKRDKASELGSQVSNLQRAVDEQTQRAQFAQQARSEFPRNYQRLVVLGKAVPENGDTASLLVQLNRIAGSSGVQFRGIELQDGGGAAPAPAPTPQPGAGAAPPASSQPSQGEPTPAPGEQSTVTTNDPGSAQAGAQAASPTEAAASMVAIGASVGPAGLSVLKYQLKFRGTFFGIADFMAGIDRLVSTGGGRVVVDGRMTTVDGFSLGADQAKGFPTLNASVLVTTYLTPSGQGLTGGATPGGPAPAASAGETQLTASNGGTE